MEGPRQPEVNLMTARLDGNRERIRFYLLLEVVVLTWAAGSLAIGGAFGVPPLLHYTITMLVIGGILAVALRLPAYRRIKGDRHYIEPSSATLTTTGPGRARTHPA
jgi:hypothetical protein